MVQKTPPPPIDDEDSFIEEMPTAILLASFEAVHTGNTITLDWKTGDETDNLGFNIFRAESKDGEFLKINNSLIYTKVGTGLGAAYSYVDEDILNRKTYYYTLEDIDIFGLAAMHGPISIDTGWLHVQQ